LSRTVSGSRSGRAQGFPSSDCSSDLGQIVRAAVGAELIQINGAGAVALHIAVHTRN
jgi:hypothetical protein